MSTAIRIEGLGKRYDINRGGAASTSLRDMLTGLVRRHGSVLGSGTGSATGMGDSVAAQGAQPALAQQFWALKGITLDIEEGERIGIIGANGAGKSTLLKILSRVTAPTEGRIEIRGKVASLLEVGTGFHPELSGRENIYLNGAILGMSHGEIRRKFDQIVEFSGVGKFLDTPVKYYSSGMYVRLAFSVSAWLDPDILIVDEVLAVGDLAFQKKCAERMRELTKEGRTVLFVSHSMETVSHMCQKALYLEGGRMMSYGPVVEAAREYNSDIVEQLEMAQMEKYVMKHGPVEDVAMSTESPKKQARPWQWHRAEFSLPDPTVEILTWRTGEAECLGGSVESETGEALTHIPIERPFYIKLRYRILKHLAFPVVPSFNFYSEIRQLFFVTSSAKTLPGIPGDYEAKCAVPPYFLNATRFDVDLNLVSFSLPPDNAAHFAAVSALRFEVCEVELLDPRRHGWKLPIPGLIRTRLDWDYHSDTASTPLMEAESAAVEE